MELIINVSLRDGRGQQVRPIRDVIITDLHGKEPEEVMSEAAEKIEGPITIAYQRLGILPPDSWEDD